MDYTENYGMRKPSADDPVDIADLNYNADIADRQMKKAADGISDLHTHKADKTEISNPNLLDNWYFADPINQRGKQTYAENGYTIDRWRFGYDANKSLKINNKQSVTLSKDAEGICTFSQGIEDWHSLAGKTVTFSVLLAPNSLYSGSVTLPDDLTVTYDGPGVLIIPGLGMNLYKTSSQDFISFRFILGEGYETSVDIIAAKLELGDRQTLAREENGKWVLNDPPPNKALELMKCQRYYWESTNMYQTIPAMYLSTLPRALAAVGFPVRMRKAPTVTIKSYKGTDDTFSDFRGYDTEVKVRVTSSNTDGFLTIVIDNYSKVVSGETYFFKVIADAEL